jgi:SulP family sulfate permease
MSQFINAIIVFFIVVLGMSVFTYIPMAVIASILMTSACRLVPKTIMRQLWNVDKFEFWILIITWLICVFKDGAVGLIVGAFLSFLKQSEKQSATQMTVTDEDGVLTVAVHGSLDYINGLHFEVKVLDEVKDKGLQKLCVDLSNALFVDVDGLYILNNLNSRKDLEVYMVHDGGDENSVLCKSALYKKLVEDGKVFKTQADALRTIANGKTA